MADYYVVVVAKSEAEAWFFFEGWAQQVVQHDCFLSLIEAEQYLAALRQQMALQYPYVQNQGAYLWSYWTLAERHYCEACADDVQVFHNICLLTGEAFEQALQH